MIHSFWGRENSCFPCRQELGSREREIGRVKVWGFAQMKRRRKNRISPSLSFLLILALPPEYYGWSNWPNYCSPFFPTVHGFILTLEANQYRWPLELGLWERKHTNQGEKAKLLKGEENSSYLGLATVVQLTGNFYFFSSEADKRILPMFYYHIMKAMKAPNSISGTLGWKKCCNNLNLFLIF